MNTDSTYQGDRQQIALIQEEYDYLLTQKFALQEAREGLIVQRKCLIEITRFLADITGRLQHLDQCRYSISNMIVPYEQIKMEVVQRSERIWHQYFEFDPNRKVYVAPQCQTRKARGVYAQRQKKETALDLKESARQILESVGRAAEIDKNKRITRLNRKEFEQLQRDLEQGKIS